MAKKESFFLNKNKTIISNAFKLFWSARHYMNTTCLGEISEEVVGEGHEVCVVGIRHVELAAGELRVVVMVNSLIPSKGIKFENCF